MFNNLKVAGAMYRLHMSVTSKINEVHELELYERTREYRKLTEAQVERIKLQYMYMNIMIVCQVACQK